MGLHFSTKISTPLLRYAVDESYDIFNGEKMKKIYDGKKKTKLGTEKRPAVVNVQTEERLKEGSINI